LILGTPLGTYVLRTKGTSEDTDMHTKEKKRRTKVKLNKETRERKTFSTTRLGNSQKEILRHNLATRIPVSPEGAHRTTLTKK
jgi:hypothetical protein